MLKDIKLLGSHSHALSFVELFGVESIRRMLLEKRVKPLSLADFFQALLTGRPLLTTWQFLGTLFTRSRSVVVVVIAASPGL